MTFEGVGITRPQKHGPFQLRLKFGKQAYCVVEVRRGEDAAELAKEHREPPTSLHRRDVGRVAR